ncbi:hypothetical protein ACFL0V_05040 [Nanoarchaeota archaeon]
MKVFIGLEIKDPYIKNPTKINQDEPFEIGARIHGFHPKKSMSAAIGCTMMVKSLGWQTAYKQVSGTNKKGGSVNFYAGDKQPVTPDNVAGDNFEQEITCYPKIHTCGPHTFTITSQADGLTTDSVLNNYIIQKEYLDNEIREYAKSKERELSPSAYQSVAKELHPEIEDWKSISEKGPIAVFMLTEQSSIIGVDENKKIKFKVAVENMLDGWLRKVESVTIILPKGLSAVSGQFCPGWEVSGEKMTLSAASLSKINFDEMKKGTQKAFPSCQFKYDGPQDEIIGTAKRLTFLASVKYNYVVQKEWNTEVRTKDGKVCPKVKGRTVNSNTGSGSATLSQSAQRDQNFWKAFNEYANKKLGAPGSNLETITFFGQSVKLNSVMKQSLGSIEAHIKANCQEGVTFFGRNPPLQGQSIVMIPAYTNYHDMDSYGITMEIDKGNNVGPQSGSQLQTTIPGCVASAFKQYNFMWEGDNAQGKYPASFIYYGWVGTDAPAGIR